MKLIIPVVITLTLFLATGCAVLAETNESTSSGSSNKDSILQKIKNRATEQIEKKLTRIEKKEERIDKRINAFTARGEKRDEIRERIASKAAQLKVRLQSFKDQKKAQKVERINDNLNKINDNQTSQMSKHLDKMFEILDKVEKRASGSATASSSAAISDAKAAIETAKAAVVAQAAKDYSLSLTTEASAGAQARAMREKLHTDLKSVREIVIDAKKSVANAIRAVAQTLGGGI